MIAVDPNRDIPERKSCYSQPGSVCKEGRYTGSHFGWRHAKSWAEVVEHLEAGALVNDRDGDKIVVAKPERNAVLLENDRNDYNYSPDQILLEDIEIIPPATPEEENEALASIMKAYEARKLDQ